MTDKKLDQLSYATKQATHTITVRSVMRGYRDTKSFSIHCKDRSIDELRDLLEEKVVFEQGESGSLVENIDYVDEASKSTHQVSVTGCSDKTVRSFRTRNPSFSSFDIANVLCVYFTGEEIEL